MFSIVVVSAGFFFLCCILFCIPSSLIFLIVPYGNPNRLICFANFLRPIRCVLLYVINMIRYIRMLSINTTILQVYTKKIIQEDSVE